MMQEGWEPPALPQTACMNGQLNEHPLGELISEISTAGLSGALRLAHERIKLVVYFDAGEIIFVASNLRMYRLATSLRRWGVVTEQQLAQVGERKTDMEFGSALVATGALSYQALEDVWARQVADVLRPALLWIHGVWDFDPRVRLARGVRVRIDTGELLMESVRRLPAEFVASRFKDKRNERLLPAEDAPVSMELQPMEAFVLSRVDMPLSVYEMLSISSIPEADALRAAYALALGGYLRREACSKALTPEAIAKARAINAAQAKAAPVPFVVPLSVEEKSEAQPPPPAPVEEEIDERQELEEMFARLGRATNYYHVLGISRFSSPDIIKRTYHRLARRFHPDRFHHEADTTLHARVETAFAQIAQAYEALKDRQTRAVYDMKIDREAAMQAKEPSAQRQKAQDVKTSKPTAAPRAPASQAPPSQTSSEEYHPEESFQQGMVALQQGNYVLAVRLIGEAARLAPKQPRYRAYYGRALGSDKHMRRQAEAEIQAAIALDAGNVSYRVMLAEFYRDIGFHRRAQGELERALAIDPGNAAARQLLDSLRNQG